LGVGSSNKHTRARPAVLRGWPPLRLKNPWLRGSPLRKSKTVPPPFDPKTLVGRWQFELSDRIRLHHRARLAEKLHDPATLEQAMAEVEREASGSAFEISAAGALTSYVDGVAYFRTTLDLAAGPVESLRIDKPTGPVTLRLISRDALVMIDPERGELAYNRVV